MQAYLRGFGTGVVALMLGAFTVSWAQTTRPAAGLSGTWRWVTEGFGGQQETVLTLKQDGDKLTGTITGFAGEMPISDGQVKDGVVTFKVVMDLGGRPLVTQYTATLTGDTLKGKSEVIISNEFEGKRSP